jgi:threonine aldolase
MTGRLVDDHRNARRLAEGLNAMRRAQIDPERVKTNIVYVNLDPAGRPAAEIVARLTDAGVRVGATGPCQFRAVTHYGISEEDIDRALKAFALILD